MCMPLFHQSDPIPVPVMSACPNQELLQFLRSDMEEFLRQYEGLDVFYYHQLGNAGDSLIAAATYQAFSRCNVRIQHISHITPVVDGSVVFLGGGGNFVPLYYDIRIAFKKLLGRAEKIILLPHTIRQNEAILRRLDERCILFCRDVESFEHVRKVNPFLDVRLAHDMAFHLDVDELLNDQKLMRAGRAVLNNKLHEAGLSKEIIQSWPNINMLRMDRESIQSHPFTDVDISTLLAIGVDPLNAPIAAWCFLTGISIAHFVYTDRLHVGIAAALLGKECILSDNSYGKNRAVYRHSLTGFPTLLFKAE
ncbi:MAG: hypothetical protein FDX21_03840 [Chlorobium sp.]|nr:MAG: hypothetical protein FDX21_03840 [Chlorobium sp.]